MPALIDTHAHLDAPEYGGGKLENVIAAARAAGVEKIISVGCDEETSAKNFELASIYPGYVYATYGFHPHNAQLFDPQRHCRLMMEALARPAVVAAGEIGLDYYRDLSPRGLQKTVFLTQLAIARELGCPAVIHIRDAFDDFREFTEGVDFNGVVHCYSGDAEFAKWAVDKGLYISFTASVTYSLKAVYRAAEKSGRSAADLLRDGALPDGAVPPSVSGVIAAVPLERIMVETDCPYLAPANLRGKLNEPANVVAVAEVLAALKGVSYEEFCRASGANARRLFPKIA